MVISSSWKTRAYSPSPSRKLALNNHKPIQRARAPRLANNPHVHIPTGCWWHRIYHPSQEEQVTHSALRPRGWQCTSASLCTESDGVLTTFPITRCSAAICTQLFYLSPPYSRGFWTPNTKSSSHSLMFFMGCAHQARQIALGRGGIHSLASSIFSY